MTGKEKFEFDGKELDYDFIDFWRFHYSNIYDIQGRIAEFIVAKALDIHESQNDQYWTLWDLTYRGLRIEVKETSYYHSFNQEGKVSQQRSFGITKANGSYDPQISGNTDFCRQNDVYVFCLNTGYTKEDSYPLNLNNWEFYIVPTSVINEKCGDNKTISLNRIKSLGYTATPYDKIRAAIDTIALKMRRGSNLANKDDVIDFISIYSQDYAGRRVKITFTDETSAEYTVLGFTSGFDNDNGMLSMEVKDRDNCTIEIYEYEVKNIEFV